LMVAAMRFLKASPVGAPGFTAIFLSPSWTPAPVIAKPTAELGKAIADPGVQEGLRKMAVKPGGPTGDAFKKRIDADIKSFADVVKAANLTFK